MARAELCIVAVLLALTATASRSIADERTEVDPRELEVGDHVVLILYGDGGLEGTVDRIANHHLVVDEEVVRFEEIVGCERVEPEEPERWYSWSGLTRIVLSAIAGAAVAAVYIWILGSGQRGAESPEATSDDDGDAAGARDATLSGVP